MISTYINDKKDMTYEVEIKVYSEQCILIFAHYLQQNVSANLFEIKILKY